MKCIYMVFRKTADGRDRPEPACGYTGGECQFAGNVPECSIACALDGLKEEEEEKKS